ncbi:MAG: type VII toxin-antitoxin system HepT family RNase toxin [Thermodesulfobacteriota bacterium]
MDDQIILAKIESLKRCIDRITAKRPASRELLSSDFDIQDIIILNLERAVQLSVDIAAHVIAEMNLPAPGSMTECFERLRDAGVITDGTAERMQKGVGFRNMAVHQYASLNWEVVYSIISKNLNDFRNYTKEIMRWIEKTNFSG